MPAQREWAARPYSDRAAVLRRAARLFEEHQQEIETWVVRESGAMRPFAALQVAGGGAEECHEAAALAGAYGELLRSGQERLSFARRRPVGVVGVIAPFNVPITLAIRGGTDPRLRGDQTPSALVADDPRTDRPRGIPCDRRGDGPARGHGTRRRLRVRGRAGVKGTSETDRPGVAPERTNGPS
ncbi:aldehyde dehydrogenase family protein [Streptomyces hokutonensis]|uniref:aldehyde dehydrogenase family protein n=1 Tax=Streptomyces hokutonensis TaxID=1306990 RepID=UPI0003A3D450